MRPPQQFFVYIMTNGLQCYTRELRAASWGASGTRIHQRYNLTCLVYYEPFCHPDAALGREKEIKGWRRCEKIKLIESMNPRWDDWSIDWENMYKPEPSVDQREIPRPA